MSTSTTILLLATAISLVVYLLGVGSAFLHIQRRKRLVVPAQLPAVSLLKPIKGLEENLEVCLRSFFEQDYPGPIEIVFASAYRDDPGIRVARSIARDYPMVRARFVMTDENWGLNPKVSNLQGALKAAAHDLVLQTDANVWAPPDYLRNIVSELLQENASLLSSLVSGVGERSVGAAMENLQLTGYVAPGCCAALKIAGIPCVIGKSMLMRKSELKALGGLELVKDSLAEDFLLGRYFEQNGKKVLLSAAPILNFNADTPVERFFARHTRWLKMRAVIHTPGFICDFFANPIALGLLTMLSSVLDPAFAAGVAPSRFAYGFAALIALKGLLEWFTLRAIRGVPMKLQHLAWMPMKDVAMFGVWLYAIFSRSVVWRGIRFRMGSDSQLLPDEGALPVRVLRRLLSA